MHGTIPEQKPEKPTTPEPKRRTITLTNRAPLRIVEDEWEELAHGGAGYDEGGDYGWDIEIFVRKQKKVSYPHYIVHAKYTNIHPVDEWSQIVRVGVVLDSNQAGRDLWKNIVAVGEQLRERIDNENLRRHVTHAVDQCFADLKPEDW